MKLFFVILCTSVLIGKREVNGGILSKKIKTAAKQEGVEFVQEIIKKDNVYFEDGFNRNLDLNGLKYNAEAQALGDKMIKTLKHDQKCKPCSVEATGFIVIFFEAIFVATGTEYKPSAAETRKKEIEMIFLEEVLAVGPVLGMGTSIHEEATLLEPLGSMVYHLMTFATGHEILDSLSRMLNNGELKMSISAIITATEFRREYVEYVVDGRGSKRKYSKFTMLKLSSAKIRESQRTLLEALRTATVEPANTNIYEVMDHFLQNNGHGKLEYIGDEDDFLLYNVVSYGFLFWKMDGGEYFSTFYTFDGGESDTIDFPSKRILGKHIPQLINPSKPPGPSQDYAETAESSLSSQPGLKHTDTFEDMANKKSSPIVTSSRSEIQKEENLAIINHQNLTDTQQIDKADEITVPEEDYAQAVQDVINDLRGKKNHGLKKHIYKKKTLTGTPEGANSMEAEQLRSRVQKFRSSLDHNPVAELVGGNDKDSLCNRILLFRVCKPLTSISKAGSIEQFNQSVRPFLKSEPKCFKSVRDIMILTKEVFNVTRKEVVRLHTEIQIGVQNIYLAVFLVL